MRFNREKKAFSLIKTMAETVEMRMRRHIALHNIKKITAKDDEKKVRQRPMNFNCSLSTLIAMKKNVCSFVTARLHSYVINIYKTVNYNHCEREQRSLF